MRLFIGIQLHPALKEQLEIVQKEVKNRSNQGSFTRKDNFHLTIYFIGEMDEKQLIVLKEQLSVALAACSPFILETAQLKSFSKKKGYIPWVGIKENPFLQDVYDTVRKVLEGQNGMPEEFPVYTPHLTLGRNVRLSKEALSELEERKVAQYRQKVTEITLFQSHQVEGILTYTPLIEFTLENK